MGAKTSMLAIPISQLPQEVSQRYPPLDRPKLTLFAEYFRKSFEGRFEDCSFVMTQGDKVLAFIPCHFLNGKVCFDNSYIDVYYFEPPTKKIAKSIYNEILRLAEEKGATQIVFQDQTSKATLSPLSTELFNHQAQHKVVFDMQVDFLGFDEKEYFRGVRKSYKSLINWGKDNLESTYVNQENYQFDQFLLHNDLYKSLNEGKEIRPMDTIEVLGELVRNGHGELGLYYLNQDLVAACLFIDEPLNTQYYTGVYDKRFRAKGIAHYPVYDGIVRSAHRHKEGFCSLGYIRTNIENPKWANIQHFKKGFSQNIKPTMTWHLYKQRP